MSNLFDAIGRPLVLPEWYAGGIDEFAAEVLTLKPHHCSYPDGQRQSSKGGYCCKARRTRAGVCEHHMATLLPIAFQDGDVDTIARRVKMLQDPRLAEVGMNIVFADQFLAIQAKKCELGGLSVQMARALEAVHKKAQRHYDEIVKESETQREIKSLFLTATPAEKDKLEKKMTESVKSWGKHFSQLGDSIRNIAGIVNVTDRDAQNWASLADANRSSIAVKQSAAAIETAKRDVVSVEEVRRCFVDIMKTMEDSVKKTLSPKEAEKVLNEVWVSCSNVRNRMQSLN